MAQKTKKNRSGESTSYYPRSKAMKKLQLGLRDFRRLCILKGIYPREARNRMKAQKGRQAVKTLYHRKDIRFLLHEPIVWKLREMKTHGKRINRAKSLKDFGTLAKLRNSYPEMSLNHIVKERYPTFLSALRDLDDCLTMCFLYGSVPLVRHIHREQPALCRRLSFEFMHAIIAGQWLRKVFISIKGYYFQAEIKGQTITWIMPHHFSYKKKNGVDLNVMSTFVQFYMILLGFVNFRLYHTLNLYYPPKISLNDPELDSELLDTENPLPERVAALNIPLQRVSGHVQPVDEEEELEIDEFDTEESQEEIEKARKEAQQIKNLKTLFKGLKVFVNREIPREPVVFTLRCFGADVSWCKTSSVGSTFDESDETITHQIVDRPEMKKQYLSRYYVQPQWIFDSVNARMLMPVERYFIGVKLPPHLSPFVDKDSQYQYVPQEQLQLEAEMTGDVDYTATPIKKRKKKKKERKEPNNEVDASEANVSDVDAAEVDVAQSEEDKAERLREEKKQKMGVKEGEVFKEDPLEKKNAERQELKLREKLIPSKHRRLYTSMVKTKIHKLRDKHILSRKKAKIERKKNQKSKNQENTS